MNGSEAKRRFTFDPTINLGHILTFVGFMASGFIAYNTLDKRLSLQEQLSAQLIVQRSEKDAIFKETLKDMQSDVKELNRSVNELAKSIDQRTHK